MKKILLLLMFSNIGCMSFTQRHTTKDYTQIEIYYLPWNYRTDGRLTIAELENLNDAEISFFCSKDKQLIDEVNTLVDVSNLTPFPEIGEIEPYMIIDFKDNSSRSQRVILDRKQLIEIDKNFYHSNLELRVWIHKNIPAAGYPNGIRTNENCEK
jgi:Txe/YoeB family toxin of Txe-Axe toxin-antitoxin module